MIRPILFFFVLLTPFVVSSELARACKGLGKAILFFLTAMAMVTGFHLVHGAKF